MTDATASLADFARNVFSQCGEDGIVEEVLRRLPEGPRWCVEFGAWDAAHLSNTRKLIDDGWSAVLIEGDAKRAAALARSYADSTRVTTVEAMVGWEGDGTLDRLLATTTIPLDFDVLSIDIDGNDFHVWKAVKIYSPRVVVIEFNPTIPDAITFVQEADPSLRKGSSARALVELAKEKGYELAAATVINLVFVRADMYPSLGVTHNGLEVVRTDHSWEMTAFMGYDGRIHFAGGRGMTWHGVPMPSEFRIVPRPVDGFPGDFGPGRKAFLHAWRRWKNRRFMRNEA